MPSVSHSRSKPSGVRSPRMAAVGLGRVIERHPERLEPEAEVIERGLDVVVGPQPLAAQLERGVAVGEGDGLVDDGDQGPVGAHHAGPVPDDPEVGVATDAHVAPERPVGRGEVEVVRLVPQRLGAGRVRGLVGRVDGPEGQVGPVAGDDGRFGSGIGRRIGHDGSFAGRATRRLPCRRDGSNQGGTMHDLVIRNGTLVDGTGAPAQPADVAVDGDRVVAVGTVDGRGPPHRRRRGRAGHARLRRHPHPPRRPAGVGPDRLVVVLARRDVGGAGQLRGHLRAVRRGRPRGAGRDDGVGRGHPRRQHPRRAGVGLDDLRRLPRGPRALAQGPQRRGDGRALRGAGGSHGGAQPRRDAGHGSRHRGHVRPRRRGHRRRCAGVLDLADAAAPRARRAPGAGHLGDRRRAHGHRHGARPPRHRGARVGPPPGRARRRQLRRHPGRGRHDGAS